MNIKEKAAEIKRRNIPFCLDEKAFNRLVLRLTSKEYAERIIVRQIASKSGYDEYSLFDDNGKIVIEATSGVAAGVALNYYLKKKCHYYIGMLTTSGVLPKTPPKVGDKIERTGLYHYRYFLNYCTFGYSFTFYRWSDWEKVIDRMILSGYNLVLNALAQECVWREVLLSLGYNEKEIAAFLVAAPFMPWLNMMNMSGYLGNYPDEWWNERVKLANKFNRRLQQFGIGVMLPGYSGMVPNDFEKHFQGSMLKDQGDWCGYDRPKYLLFSDKNFDRIADLFYSTQNRLIGKGSVHYYSSDPFHEGGVTDGIDLAEFAKTAFCAMQRNDNKAVWCFQGWEDNPKREMLSAIPADRTLVCNLLSDTNTNAGDNYLNRPWLYCTVNNFGGQHLLRGGLARFLNRPFGCVSDDNYTMVGIGLMPEAVENDEVFFDILAETAINAQKTDLEQYLKTFISARYGKMNDSLFEAWKTLAEKIYLKDDISTSFESSYLCLPSLSACKVSAFAVRAEDRYPDELITAVKILLNNYEECKNSSSYIFDLVDITRQASANFSWSLVYSIQKAYNEKDLSTLKKRIKLYFKLFELQDKICSCHKRLLFSNYLKYPKEYSKKEAIFNVYTAKRLITVWGDERTKGRLNDYAAREYGGLLKNYYLKRWKKFADMLVSSLVSGTPLEDYDFLADGEAFTRKEERYKSTPYSNADEVARKIIGLLEENRDLCGKE